MRLIVGSNHINTILCQAVSEFKQTRQESKVFTTDSFQSAFWREIMYDLVRLSVVSPPVGIRYSHTLYALLYPNPVEAIADRYFWDQYEIDFDKIIGHGLSSLTPVEFVLFALQPLGVDFLHEFLNDARQSGEVVADEWHDVYRVAVHYMMSTDRKCYTFCVPGP